MYQLCTYTRTLTMHKTDANARTSRACAPYSKRILLFCIYALVMPLRDSDMYIPPHMTGLSYIKAL